ncbi:hypothetical protein FHG64_17745 [Antarcticibacterium flavum]|uniref:DUF4133 domain-containing protein n=1 Tax=Antarcticibacterium flavum TaxID=2058175 RepID=A0A5B7X7L9_9FLAO|nr:hypothetical protein [Antarcticibacterium sp. W02-3]MCM4160865.1 hypothetical protein [Antarcticibacterium sp. W02-3]QCY71090.1 hypothetical protein FHG64_17745 [Antarcticibacterium flavum]
MKRYEVYRNIRKQAMIFGLSLPLFALLMIAVIASLLVIIFSFSFTVVISVFVLNAVLYICLLRFSANSQLFQVAPVFPKIISAKKSSLLDYEQD